MSSVDDPELEDLLGSAEAAAVNSSSSQQKDDAELSQLLDSALRDFAPAAPTPGPTDESEGPHTARRQPRGDETSDDELPFLSELLKGFAELTPPSASGGATVGDIPQPTHELDFLKGLLKEDPQMMGQFEHLAQAACKVDESEDSQKEFSESLTSTLTALTENMESLQGQLSEQEMMAALAGLNLGDAGPKPGEGELRDDISLDGDDDEEDEATTAAANGPTPAFLPMLGGMMRSILSKEVLYPSLKEIASVYPAWLEDSKDKLSQEEFMRFEKQYIVISEVCDDFEAETEASSEDEKQHRFERVLIHMQKMHELGQPPKDLLLKLDPSMEFNTGGIPMMPQADQCALM